MFYHGTCHLFDSFNPDLIDGSHVFSCKPVSHKVSAAIEAAPGKDIPAEVEDAVSKFFKENGITYLAWSQVQTKPDENTNRAVLDAECIKILKIEQIRTDEKNKLIKGAIAY